MCYVLEQIKILYRIYEKLKIIEQYKKGKVESTKNKGEFRLIYFEEYLNQRDATHREKYLKTYLGKMFLRNRLKSYLTG